MIRRLAWTSGICSALTIGLVLARSATGAVILSEAAQNRLTVADENTFSRTLRFGGTGERTLVVRLINGSIRVSGSNEATVDLQVRRRIRAESDADARQAERDVTLDIADNAPLIGAIARQPDSNICGERSDGRGWWRRPRYQVTFDVTVRVPRGTRLELCTINGGEISVEQTMGDFNVSHVNGRITMTDMRGSGSAETVNGTVAVSFAETPAAASAFKTVNGRVTATFPGGLSADFRLKTGHGELLTDFDVQPLPQPAPVAERRGTRFVYRSNNFTHVRVGRGGPEITLETFNGDVRIVRAAR